MRTLYIIVLILGLISCRQALVPNSERDTFIPFDKDKTSQRYEDLWKRYDPRKEPLEIEILHEWEEDSVICKIIRYRIGIFKGKRSMMAAIYGYPVGGQKLPGLVQIHGGGQYADYRAVVTNAKRGYATISIAWAGRINAPGYKVNPEGVKLFWENKTNDPDYKITTDWGSLDAYHAPCKNPSNGFEKVAPASWTLDSVKSPRNNSWFLCTLGARRALTFLEQQPEVDPHNLGVYGHSMGGKITVMTATDPRVKAAAPSCGGLSDRYSDEVLYSSTLGDDVYLKQITCPIIFLSPSNDFHGRINDLQKAIYEIKSKQWRVSCSPHNNHQDTPEYSITGLLWFDQYLKGTFSFPKTPESFLELKTNNHVPVFKFCPDSTRPILYADIYYTQQGQNEGEKDDMVNTINRFWHHAKAKQTGNQWTADIPLGSIEKTLWVYANVVYTLDKPEVGAGYYYNPYTARTFCISTKMHMENSVQLKEAGIIATLKPSLVIEPFEEGWQKEWFSYNSEGTWPFRTHKLHDDLWKAPSKQAILSLEILSKQDNKLKIELDEYTTVVDIKAKSGWREIVLRPSDFKLKENSKSTGKPKFLPAWMPFGELVLGPGKTPSKQPDVSPQNKFIGEQPSFRNMRWKYHSY